MTNRNGRGLAQAIVPVFAILSAAGIFAASADQATGPFTAAQATAGHAAFLENCATCHQKSMQGGGEAPALAGTDFINSWGGRGVDELYGIIKAAMPLGNPGGLNPETYQQIVAFILEANGAVPGSADRIAISKAKISGFANGKMPSGFLEKVLPTAPAQAASNVASGSRRPTVGRSGITVAGTVKNYTPVTDEMLMHPA